MTESPKTGLRPKLFERIGLARGPIAFLDESFLAPSEHDRSFYILCAVLIEKKSIFKLRSKLAHVAGRSRWHTTEMGRSPEGRQQIKQLASLTARSTNSVVVLVEDIEPADSDAEIARAKAMRALFHHLATDHMYLTGTVIYEKRLSPGMAMRDQLLFENIRNSKVEGSKLKTWGMASKSEPLLWLPDLVAWCFRQAVHHDNDEYLSDLEKSLTVIRL